MKVLVIGAGLIGTSIALGVKGAGGEVELIDSDGRAQSLANDLVSIDRDEEGYKGIVDPDVVVIATPTSALKLILERYKNLYPKSTFIDIGSTKTKVTSEVQSDKTLATRFVPTHPMAGRELDGAEAAQSDLFVGKSWVITPTGQCDSESVDRARRLIESLGAKVISMDAKDHDAAVAAVSHLPQIISSLLAGQLADKSEGQLALSGSGVIDTTRIAGSNPDLWSEILLLNRDALMPLLENFQRDLSTFIDTFDVRDVLERGREGRGRLPGKHRSASRNYTYLPIVLEDKPNQLAALFDECATADVNVEDISIEHSPEQETGLVLLALSKENAAKLQTHLLSRKWRVHPPRSEK